MRKNKLLKLFLIGLIAFIAISAFVLPSLYPGYILCKTVNSDIPRIAHAGGGYQSLTYTDSLDALNANRDHYDLFEIDFNTTSDNEIVCIHDWEASVERTFDVPLSSVPTLAEFEHLVSKNKKYSNCTLATLIKWLEQNPDKKIVTDIKDKNLEVLTQIAKKYPSFINQFIPQIYSIDEYNGVKNLGYKEIIYTIYKYRKSDNEVLRASKNMQLFALTMPTDRVTQLAPRAACMGIPSYAHTINSDKELQELKRQGISEIYTDWLKER